MIPGTGVVPAAAAFAQEADDMEETLLGRESRLCWACGEEARTREDPEDPDEKLCVCAGGFIAEDTQCGVHSTCRRDLDGDVFPV